MKKVGVVGGDIYFGVFPVGRFRRLAASGCRSAYGNQARQDNTQIIFWFLF